SIDDATSALVAVDLQVSKTQQHATDPFVPAGQVAGTDPGAGEAVAHGGVVQLIISDGPAQLELPDLVGESEDVAKERVTDGGFSLEASSYQFDPEIAEGLVIDALGKQGDETVSLQTLEVYGELQPVTLVVSLGQIPSVTDLTVEEAQTALAGKKLTGVEGAHAFHDTIAAGKVISAKYPEDGPLREGGTVELIISDGIEQVEVPDVVGKDLTAAKAMLTDLGFAVSYNKSADAFPSFVRVRSTSPEAGELVDKGSTIELKLRSVLD